MKNLPLRAAPSECVVPPPGGITRIAAHRLSEFLPTEHTEEFRASDPSVHAVGHLLSSVRRLLSSVRRRSFSPSFLLSVLFTFAFTATACAQWQTPTYTLRGGYNAIYLHGDATHTTPDLLFAANPEILSVWRWVPNTNLVQVSSSSLLPSTSSPEWTVWVRGEPTQTTLSSLPGQNAYLIRCAGVATTTYSLALPQRPLPPRNTWVRNGANLLGFPTRAHPTGGTYPTFSTYFETFPAAIAGNTAIYKYIGGDIGPANPAQIFSPLAERVDRHQAYWFDATVVGTFYAPLEITPSNLDGLTFGRTGARVIVRVRNRTSAPVTLTIAPTTSVAAPIGQEAIVGVVPLTRITLNAATLAYTETPFTEAYTEAIAPQTSVEFTFGLNRAEMTGAVGALYASFLRFTDSGNLLDVSLPASARAASLAGLWVGDVAVTNVQSKAPGATGSATSRSYPLRVLLHLDDNGVARLLSQVFLGRLAPAPYAVGLCTRETGLKPDAKATATRLVSVTMPLDTEVSTGTGTVAIGSTLVRTITIPFNDRTNPFVHAYHPDHDNKDARLVPLSAGVESYSLSRECRFNFAATPPSGSSTVGWGATVIGGSYTEIVTGLHKQPLTVYGTFELRRVSEIGSITLN